MSTSTYGKQFVLLNDWQIHEAIGATQQSFNTIKTKNVKEVVAKIDLAIAYYMVSLMYFRLILTHPRFCVPFFD